MSVLFYIEVTECVQIPQKSVTLECSRASFPTFDKHIRDVRFNGHVYLPLSTVRKCEHTMTHPLLDFVTRDANHSVKITTD